MPFGAPEGSACSALSPLHLHLPSPSLWLAHLALALLASTLLLQIQTPSHLRDFAPGIPLPENAVLIYDITWSPLAYCLTTQIRM